MKKLLSLVLSLMMLFTVAGVAEENQNIGVIGSADGPTSMLVGEELNTSGKMVQDAIAAGRKVTMTFSIPVMEGINLGDATINGALTDLIKALGAYVSMQGDEYNMCLTLSQQDVLTLGVAVNGQDAYIKSNLIGGTVVIGSTEIETIISRLLDALVMMEAITGEDANEYKEGLSAMMDELEAVMGQSTDMVFTEEDLRSLDFSAITGAIMNLAGQVETVDEIVVPRMCDPATKGVRLSIDNEEFVSVLRACLQFVEDNPKLKNYIAAQGDYYTEEELADMWAQDGDVFMEYGIYASEEEFREDMKTFDQVMADASRMLEDEKALDGEFITTVYMNDADEIVYLTSILPMFSEEPYVYEVDASAEVKGTTEVLNLVYSRQTVAQGVSHVCNIDVEGEGLTIDVLAQENGVQIRLSDMASQALLLTINAVDDNGGIKGTYVTNEEEATVYSGNFGFSHMADEASIKTAVTFDMTSVYTPAEGSGEVPSLNGMTLPGYQPVQPKEKTDTLAISYLCDYARDGVDVNGKETFDVRFNDVHVVAECALTTSDPDESIMAGEVVRPAELDEAAFLNWFVGAANSVSSWLGTLMMALPESVLSLVLSMGMM